MTKTFLLEIGTEELPSSAIQVVEREGVPALAHLLENAGLSHGAIELITTPRRVAFLVSDLAEATEAVNKTITGPSKEIAFDSDGNLTPAGAGFLRSKKLNESDIAFDDTGHIVAHIEEPAISAVSILEHELESFIGSFGFNRTQRWGKEQVRFVRPVRSLVALMDNEPLNLTYGDVKSDTHLFGHRVLSPEGASIDDARTYEDILKSIHVLDQKTRAQAIEDEILKYEQKHGVKVSRPSSSFSEVVNLVEWPSLLEAEFDADFLSIPQEIISESLLSHQRYFPVLDANGNLTQKFIVIGNADPSQNEQVVRGNERVVRARLDDARFFYEADLGEGLSTLSQKLGEVTFHKSLGSLKDKTARLVQLAPNIARLMGATQAEQKQAKRAAELMKADLVSQTVIEFTNQQGVVGGYIARAEGEEPAVAEAIASQYLPRFSGDTLPEGIVATAVSVADKLDTLAGLFAIGDTPTGSRDPFALRRQTIGILHMLMPYANFDMDAALDTAFAAYEKQGIKVNIQEAKTELLAYIFARLDQIAKEEGISPDIIQAISGRSENPSDYFARARALASVRESQGVAFEQLLQAYARAAHLADPKFGTANAHTSFKTHFQETLAKALQGVQKQVREAQAAHKYDEALEALTKIKQPLDIFFESTLIMDEDPSVRKINLQLLNSLQELFETIAHFDALSKQEN